jgi:hypothetical protein
MHKLLLHELFYTSWYAYLQKAKPKYAYSPFWRFTINFDVGQIYTQFDLGTQLFFLDNMQKINILT